MVFYGLHAMRILGSYESGEELTIEIMRDKRKVDVKLEIPDRTQSSNLSIVVPSDAATPVQRVKVIQREVTRVEN